MLVSSMTESDGSLSLDHGLISTPWTIFKSSPVLATPVGRGVWIGLIPCRPGAFSEGKGWPAFARYTNILEDGVSPP